MAAYARGFEAAQKAYENQLPPGFDDEDDEGYCEECGEDKDQHDFDCSLSGTTWREREAQHREDALDAAGDAAYEMQKDRQFDMDEERAWGGQ
jgi:hypothetical protein